MIRPLSYLIALTNLFLIVFIGFFLFWPVQTATILNEPFPVFPQTVEAGETVAMTIEYIRHRQYQSTVDRALICGARIYDLESVSGNSPIGEFSATIHLVIPKEAYGECYIKSDVIYHNNFLRTEYSSRVSKTFTII